MASTVVLEIVVFAIVYACITFFLQRKVSNMKKVNELKDRIYKIQKEFGDMVKSNAPKAELDKKQQEMMSLLSESMKYQMKGMFVVVPFFLIIYYLVLPALFAAAAAGTLLTIFSTNLNYQTLFIVTAFLTGIFLLILVAISDKIRTSRQEQKA